MRRPGWRRISAAVAAVAVAIALAFSLGIRLPLSSLLSPFFGSRPLDYSATPSGRFPALDDAYLRHVLGGVLAPSRPATTASEASSKQGDVPQSGPPASLLNDDFARATSIGRVPFESRDRTAGASRESGEPAGCGTLDGGTVWFRYTPSSDVGLVADTFGSSYATTLAVYRLASLKASPPLACDEDVRGNSVVAFAAEAGATYYLQVGAALLEGGELMFHLVRQGTTTLTSLSSDGEQGLDQSIESSLSGDGRFVAFSSYASNLADHSLGCESTVYFCQGILVRDRKARRTEVVSVSSRGAPANASADKPAISADGRFVAFQSAATNLVEGPVIACLSNGESTFSTSLASAYACSNVFVHDRITRETTLVSVASDGSPARGDSGMPDISADGRFVSFESTASNLVPGDTNQCGDPLYTMALPPDGIRPTNCKDVFVHDRLTHRTTRVSVSSTGTQSDAPSHSSSISGDGNVIAFASSASSLAPCARVPGRCQSSPGQVQGYVRDRAAGETTRIASSIAQPALQGGVYARQIAVSEDGGHVAFVSDDDRIVEGDRNHVADVFVLDRSTGRQTRVSIASSGGEANGASARVSISRNGRYVAFGSEATNLAPGGNTCTVDAVQGETCTDVFLHDLVTRGTYLVAVSTSGEPGNDQSMWPAISGDGSVIAFQSAASNLASNDSNICAGSGYSVSQANCVDIFTHERPRGTT